ncbi:ABC transporter ATP-binding protein [Trinickia dinghuensis]|uniref:sn-glycerol-3-phosphate ABC transporter ATP-binding protein UgpC n=1 Tax=Trinickia dinghuensis TaxID=2291023 RepID=A0A3D8JVH3_9BURK|nr:sn-glycerol-3-phosphate ABC transporter ATP-binding protein UgpC [Trinickia dinghuensis]RDU96725.1 sn-glycerol-3-phosphate ABC transporter ATP-binding protein UgpC [Trinickia dinghuensis]
MTAISIEGVSKHYGDVPVLRNIDIEIRSGEFIVLVGPSGCGKSTLLRMIAGLESVGEGHIRIGNRLVNELPPRDRDLAMVFQSYALYPHMSVADNMRFTLKLRKTAEQRIEESVNAASAKLGLNRLLGRKPRDLSGGQRQRVAMGRAIVRQPQAFLFDEPLSNLDARLREQMRYEIRKLQRDLGATSIYVTHDQIEAMTMADRIVALHAGDIQQIGPPRELYDDPANVFVAGFIGSPAMNFLKGELTGDRSLVTIAGHFLRLSGRAMAGAEGQSVTVGLRPERIVLSPLSPNLTARVENVETTGLGVIVHLDCHGQPMTIFMTNLAAPNAGEIVGLRIDPADVLLFDPDSGQRIRVA